MKPSFYHTQKPLNSKVGWLVGWLVCVCVFGWLLVVGCWLLVVGCVVVWLCGGCVVVLLCGCLVVWLFGCLVVWSFGRWSLSLLLLSLVLFGTPLNVCVCTLHITRAKSYLANSTHADLETWACACPGNHPTPVLC